MLNVCSCCMLECSDPAEENSLSNSLYYLHLLKLTNTKTIWMHDIVYHLLQCNSSAAETIKLLIRVKICIPLAMLFEDTLKRLILITLFFDLLVFADSNCFHFLSTIKYQTKVNILNSTRNWFITKLFLLMHRSMFHTFIWFHSSQISASKYISGWRIVFSFDAVNK